MCLLTVTGEISSRSAIACGRVPAADHAQHLRLASCQTAATWRAADLGQQLEHHRAGDERLSGPRETEYRAEALRVQRAGYVAQGAGPHRLQHVVDIGRLGQNDDDGIRAPPGTTPRTAARQSPLISRPISAMSGCSDLAARIASSTSEHSAQTSAPRLQRHPDSGAGRGVVDDQELHRRRQSRSRAGAHRPTRASRAVRPCPLPPSKPPCRIWPTPVALTVPDQRRRRTDSRARRASDRRPTSRPVHVGERTMSHSGHEGAHGSLRYSLLGGQRTGPGDFNAKGGA